MNPRIEAGLSAEDLVFTTHDEAYTLSTKDPLHGAPSRFLYWRTREEPSDIIQGWVHAWVPDPPTDWGRWEPIADMRFNDEEEIEQAMRNMARLGLDTGPLGL